MHLQIQEVIHFYGTHDLEKTKAFYTEILPLTLKIDQGKCHIYHITDTASIGFCTHIQPVFSDKSPIITLVVDDVGYWHQHLIKHNITVEPILISQEFKIEHFFLKDPNGYTLEIQRFLSEKELG